MSRGRVYPQPFLHSQRPSRVAARRREGLLGAGGYPSLTEILNKTREELPPGYIFELKDDIVRIYDAKK